LANMAWRPIPISNHWPSAELDHGGEEPSRRPRATAGVGILLWGVGMWASDVTRRCLEPRCLVKRLQARGRITGGGGAQDRCNHLLVNYIATMAAFAFHLARMMLNKISTLTSG
jgi:hypothetical protein